MKPQRFGHIKLLATMIIIIAGSATAQKFTIASFRQLPNDISAFVNPVMDLNDDGCALIKVSGSPDFVFSTPLGIVKRVDNVGEIWLYLPRNSKKITVKHPEWGVLRDYVFPVKIESRMTYEMTVDQPETVRNIEVSNIGGKITTIRDTLVVTQVDTLVIAAKVKPIPFSSGVLLTVSYGSNSRTGMGGLMVTGMRRHGGFLHFSTDFGSFANSSKECGRFGEIEGKMPYYSGNKRHGSMIINAGAIHRLSQTVNVFEGVGYGFNRTLWQLADSEGGEYVRNSYYSHHGFSFEAGATLTFSRIMVSASVISIKGAQWYGTIGIGIRIGKK